MGVVACKEEIYDAKVDNAPVIMDAVSRKKNLPVNI